MGQRGPKPKPREIVVLEGNPSRVSLVPEELVVSSELPPVKPDIVDNCPRASAEWDRVIAAMPPGLYSALDVAVLTQYALAWHMLHEAQDSLDQDGLTIATKEGVKSNPAMAAWTQAQTTLMKCADRLGLTPGARRNLELPKPGSKPGGKFSTLLGRT